MPLTRPKSVQIETVRKPKHKDGHFMVSMVKSVIRIVGCYALYLGAGLLGDPVATPITLAAGAFAAAEVLGIVEELV